jgi:hypothetical protein
MNHSGFDPEKCFEFEVNGFRHLFVFGPDRVLMFRESFEKMSDLLPGIELDEDMPMSDFIGAVPYEAWEEKYANE